MGQERLAITSEQASNFRISRRGFLTGLVGTAGLYAVESAFPQTAEAKSKKKKIKFKTVLQGNHNKLATDSYQLFAIKARDAYREILKALTPQRPLEDIEKRVNAIDFSRNQVNIGIDKKRPTAGYSIQFKEFLRKGRNAVAKAISWVPRRRTPRASAITEPFHGVVTPKINGTIFLNVQTRQK